MTPLRPKSDPLFAIQMLFALLLVSISADAAEVRSGYLLRHWDNEHGLPASSVTRVAGTRDGYLWVGTGNGLARFDGDRFWTPRSAATSALQGEQILSLAADAQGGLWVGTQEAGLFRLRGGKLESVVIRGRRVRVNSLAVDKEGGILAAVSDYGVMRSTGADWVHVATNGLALKNVTEVIYDANGLIWCLADGRPAFAQGDQWKQPSGVAHSDPLFRIMAIARQGGVWLAANLSPNNTGIQIIHLRSDGTVDESSHFKLTGGSRSMVTCMAEDDSGTIWVGTYGDGVFFRPPGGEWSRFEETGPLAELIVNLVVADDDGSVWLGMGSGGLYQIRRTPVTALRLPDAARQNVVLVACGTRDGSVWVGTDGAGAFRYRSGVFTEYGASQGLDNQHVGVMLEDRNGTLWAGTEAGLSRFEGDGFRTVVSGFAILSLFEDHEGRLWMGFSGGVGHVVGDGVKFYRQREGLPGTEMIALAEGQRGQIWVAAPRYGLYYRTNETFVRFAPGQWPEERDVRSLHCDASGVLWVSSYGRGLLRLKEGQLERWNTADGLPDDGIHAVIEDDDGNLWMASNNGVFACSKRELEGYKRGESLPLLCRQVSIEDGMSSKVCTGYAQPVVARTEDGRFWFPNRQALAVFNPREFRARSEHRVPVVNEVLADGEVQRVVDDELRLSAQVRRLEFRFTAPDLVSGGRLRFCYSLEGADQEWVNGERQRVAYYHHLPPGRYRFKLKVGGPDGVWTEGIQTLKLILLPQWWQRRDVRAAAVLFAGGIVAFTGWGVARARARRKLRQLELRAGVERERRRIAQDLHDELGAGLTQLMLQAEAVGGEATVPVDVRDRAMQMANQTRQLATTTDEIVWTLNPRNDSLPNLVGYLCDFGQAFLGPCGVRCRLDVTAAIADRPIGAVTRHNLLLAFKEAFNNVVKHAHAKEVWVRIRTTPDELTVAVEDDGVGFDLQKVPDAGNGLANMRERMTVVGGRTEIKRQPVAGMSVTFTVPLTA